MSIFHDSTSLMHQARKQLQEKKVVNPYAVGTAVAMKLTGDKPPLEKSTITKAHKIAKRVEKASYEPEIINHLIENGFAETEQNAVKIMENMSEDWKNYLIELRRSEKEGKGSPESAISYPGRASNRERGAKGGRHHYSGSVKFGGSASERGKKKNQPGSQHQRLNPTEKPGRQLERGSRAATERAYGYGQGRYQGD